MRYILTPPVHGGNAWWQVHDVQSKDGEADVVADVRVDAPDAEQVARGILERWNNAETST